MEEHNRGFKFQLGGRDLETAKYEKDVGVLVSNDLNHLQRQDHILEAVQDLCEAPSRVLSGSLVTLDRGGQEGVGAGATESC